MTLASLFAILGWPEILGISVIVLILSAARIWNPDTRRMVWRKRDDSDERRHLRNVLIGCVLVMVLIVILQELLH